MQSVGYLICRQPLKRESENQPLRICEALKSAAKRIGEFLLFDKQARGVNPKADISQHAGKQFPNMERMLFLKPRRGDVGLGRIVLLNGLFLSSGLLFAQVERCVMSNRANERLYGTVYKVERLCEQFDKCSLGCILRIFLLAKNRKGFSKRN